MNFQEKNVFIFLIVLFLCTSVYAAFEKKGAGVQFISNGSAGIADSSLAFALFNNPAQVARQDGLQINAFMRNFYQIKDLNQINFHTGFRIGKIAFAAGVQRYGNNLYSETEIRIGASYILFKALAVGFSLNYYALHIKRYFDAGSLGMDLGVQYSINRQFSLGCLLSNFNEPQIGTVKERLPRQITLGFCYYPINSLSLMLDIVKEDKFDFDYRFGIHCRINKWLAINCGFMELADTFTTGFLLAVSRFRGGYALEYHQILNLSHSFEVQYGF